MLKELLFLITLVWQLLVPLVELSFNIWNIYNINEMIKDPASGYGKSYIFEAFTEEIDPWIPLVTSPIGKYLSSDLELSTLNHTA